MARPGRRRDGRPPLGASPAAMHCRAVDGGDPLRGGRSSSVPPAGRALRGEVTGRRRDIRTPRAGSRRLGDAPGAPRSQAAIRSRASRALPSRPPPSISARITRRRSPSRPHPVSGAIARIAATRSAGPPPSASPPRRPPPAASTPLHRPDPTTPPIPNPEAPGMNNAVTGDGVEDAYRRQAAPKRRAMPRVTEHGPRSLVDQVDDWPEGFCRRETAVRAARLGMPIAMVSERSPRPGLMHIVAKVDRRPWVRRPRKKPRFPRSVATS